VGGVPALAKLIPIKNYYDHGLPQTLGSDLQAEFIEAYKQTTEGKSITLKPGDEIKLQRAPRYLPPLDIRVIAAGGMVLGRTYDRAAGSAMRREFRGQGRGHQR
jgi:hypothetical protein